MKWKLLLGILIVIGIIYYLISFLNFDWKIPANNWINYHFNPIDKSCQNDSDCMLTKANCSPCACPDATWAVNKKWKPLCLIPDSALYDCLPCPFPRPDVICQKGACVLK